VDEEPALVPRGGDGVEHATACHFPVEAGEDLVHAHPTIDQPDREPLTGLRRVARSTR